jgi:FkbM family methyltransferase
LPSFIWQFKEIFVDEIYKFNSKNEEPIIYDCGANIGMSCLYFKILYPKARIKAFEADPIITDVLKLNLARNGINDVEIINKAVWIDYNGVEFGRDGADGGSIYLMSNKIKVDSIRLKDFLDDELEIDFLKIDIEGAEVRGFKRLC